MLPCFLPENPQHYNLETGHGTRKIWIWEELTKSPAT